LLGPHVVKFKAVKQLWNTALRGKPVARPALACWRLSIFPALLELTQELEEPSTIADRKATV
jgi:hypothetical protein